MSYISTKLVKEKIELNYYNSNVEGERGNTGVKIF